jgi:hypothetical protein
MGRFRSFISWYRLKSDAEHLFVKMSGKDYLEEQPETLEDADALARETFEATQEIRDLQKNENRLLIVKLDLRDCDMSDLNLLPFLKYGVAGANQNLFIERVEVWGSAGAIFGYIKPLLPKYTRDRLMLIETDE